jgi:hypothetical protein
MPLGRAGTVLGKGGTYLGPVKKAMSKQTRSKLTPYASLIASLRKERRSYREIVEILRDAHGVLAGRNTVHSFVKVRAKKPKKVYTMLETPGWHLTPDCSRSNRDEIPQANDGPGNPRRRRFQFSFSDQYNLTRLTPEEKAAYEKQLDEELGGQP